MFASYFSNAAIELTVGTIALAFVLYGWLGARLGAYLGRPPAKPRSPQAAMGVFWGAMSGFTSTLIQVDGPPFYNFHPTAAPGKTDPGRHHGHFLHHRELDQDRSLFCARPVLDPQSRHLGALAAARRRHQLSRHRASAHHPTERFYRIAYILMILIAIALLLQGVRGFVGH